MLPENTEESCRVVTKCECYKVIQGVYCTFNCSFSCSGAEEVSAL